MPILEQEPKENTRAAQSIIVQISVLLASINELNYSEVEQQIYFLISKSSFLVYAKYWEKLLILNSSHIKEYHTLDIQIPLQKLLYQSFQNLKFKTTEVIKFLNETIFENIELENQVGLSFDDIISILDPIKDQGVIERLKPEIVINKLQKLQSLTMDVTQTLQNIILHDSPKGLEASLGNLLCSLEGESLNECIALILSEISSPGSQQLQSTSNSWFTPISISEATQRGIQIYNALTKLDPLTIDWNRVFNLVLTKYFLNKNISPTLASISSLFSVLNHSQLIDQFFNCDWNLSFKLHIVILIHQWSVQKGCIDILNIPGLKKVSNLLPNPKKSLLYLLSIAKLDIELFLLRDELSNDPLFPTFHECFFEDYNIAPEYLVAALISEAKYFRLSVDNESVLDELLVTLMVQVFEKSQMVFGKVLSLLSSDKILDIGRVILKKENISLLNFVQALSEENILQDIFNRIPFRETLKLTPSARKVGWDGFEDYMTNNLSPETVPIILEFLSSLIIVDQNTSEQSLKIYDLKDLYFVINLMNSSSLSKDQRNILNDIQFKLLLSFPRLTNFGHGHDQIILANEDLAPISSDVEKEMQMYLQKMYNKEMAIKDIVDILRRLRDSDNPRDQDVFACITHAVITETSFFKEYPLDALATTSVLFGSMILFEMLRGFVLDVAFQIIFNFAKEGPESKMFKFSVQALYAFRMRLHEYPTFCKSLIEEIPSLQTQPQIYQILVESGSYVSDYHSSISSGLNSGSNMIPLNYFNINTIPVKVIQENPSRDIIEKVLFVVNNITMDNFEVKSEDLKNILENRYFVWFSNYLVNQRAKIEPNYHKLYSKLIFSTDSHLLHDYMLNATYKTLFLLLSTKDLQSTDKNYLKNLGSWLGCITLANSKPIKHENIAFRELLLDAHKNDRLEVIVPFVTKVLQQAKDSKIFRPPNPWTIGILRVLLELNEKENWKLSLTFEVEVLFKSFNLKLNDLEPSNFMDIPDVTEHLSGNISSLSIEQQQNEQQQQIVLMQQYQQQMLLLQHRQQHQRQQPLQQRIVSNALTLPTEQSHINIDTTGSNDGMYSNLVGNSVFVTHPDLKRLFQMAMSKSVREILVPAVEKSSSIAVITTVSIVLKDFATEVDEIKLRTAAIMMVRQLAQSLAHSTSIELLKDTIRTTTQSLTPNMINMITSPLDQLNMAINDNITLALSPIEKAAVEKSVQDVSDQLMQSIIIRRYHKERRSDQPFCAQNINSYSLTLPDPLGLKPTGVTPQQFRIYEDFAKPSINSDQVTQNVINGPINMMNQHMQQQQQKNILLQQLQQNQVQLQNQATLQHSQHQSQSQPQSHILSSGQNELEQNHRVLVHLMDSLVASIKENPDKQWKELGTENPIKDTIFQILNFIFNSVQKDQLALKVSQAVANSLFGTGESILCREVLSFLLEKLCSLSIVAKKDVVWWLVYALDPRKFNAPVVRSLLEVNLINISELDSVIVTAMKNSIEGAQQFAINLIRDTVLSENPLLMRLDFVLTLDCLRSINTRDVQCFFKEFQNTRVLPVSKSTKVTKKERIFLVFTEWVKLLQRVGNEDPIIIVFIKQMMDKGVIDSSDKTIEFIKAALELSVRSFKESDPTGEVFITIDALSKLIIKLLELQDFTNSSRKEYLTMILNSVSIIFAKDHEINAISFNERPYFRLYSSLLCEWEYLRGHRFIKIRDAYIREELCLFDEEFYNSFAMYFHMYQPIAFPGFSFAWVTLISHRMFLPAMLRLCDGKGWANLVLLLSDLLKFLTLYIKKDDIADSISVVYKGALRIFLAIANDVPEFLVENHYELINQVPATCIQLKNVILSSFPKKMVIPNPFSITSSMRMLKLCEESPKYFYDPIHDLQNLRKPVDNYLRIPSSSLMRTISTGIFRNEYENENGVGYTSNCVDVKLIHAIVLHIGIEACIEKQKTSTHAVFNTQSSYFVILRNLIHEGSEEVKFHIIEAMCYQLRYPNAHTCWFNYCVRMLFISDQWNENDKIIIQEIIIRCLLERLITNKPHSWGVVVTFIEMLQSNEVKLLELECIKNIPEIKMIFHNLGKYVGENKSMPAIVPST